MFRVPTTVCIGLDATIVSAYTKINKNIVNSHICIQKWFSGKA